MTSPDAMHSMFEGENIAQKFSEFTHRLIQKMAEVIDEKQNTDEFLGKVGIELPKDGPNIPSEEGKITWMILYNWVQDKVYSPDDYAMLFKYMQNKSISYVVGVHKFGNIIQSVIEFCEE